MKKFILKLFGITPIDDKSHPRFIAGYMAGLKDGQYESEEPRTAFPTYQDASGKWFYIDNNEVIYPYGEENGK